MSAHSDANDDLKHNRHVCMLSALIFCIFKNKRMFIMLKAAVYKAVIILVLMCGSETWALRNAVQNFLERTDMTMLIWMMRIKSIA